MDVSSTRLRVAVLFGGPSLEHEISVLTALQVMEAFDREQYEVIPVYVDLHGLWYTGPALYKRKSYPLSESLRRELHRVTLVSGKQFSLQQVQEGRRLFWRRQKSLPIDLIFPAVHGSIMEDGCLQGYLEMLGVPYVGPRPLAAAVAMDKAASKTFARAHGIPVLPGKLLSREDWDPMRGEELICDLLKSMPLPVIVKPVHLGSSLGVSSAYNADELLVSIAAAFILDHQILIEPLIEERTELNVAVMRLRDLHISAVERPKYTGPVLSFEKKYMGGGPKKTSRNYEGMASLGREINPKDLPPGILDKVRHDAATFYDALELSGISRMDFLLDRRTGGLYFNEVNPIPGSLAYYLWESSSPSIGFTQLLHLLVQDALVRHRERSKSQRSIQWRVFQQSTLA